MPVLKYYCGHCFKEIEIEPHFKEFCKNLLLMDEDDIIPTIKLVAEGEL